MRRASLLLWLLLFLGGCVSQGDINAAVRDDLRFTGRIMGFALDARVESLKTRIALLKAFKDDPKLKQLEQELGTLASLEQRLNRVHEAKRSLVEEHQRLMLRYPDPQEQ